MLSGCCGAGCKPAGSAGHELSLSCTMPAALLWLGPSSASVMRWHSSPSREGSVCLREKKTKPAMPGKYWGGITAKVAFGMSGQGGCERSAGCRGVVAGMDYLKDVPCWTLSELQDGAFLGFLLIPTWIWGSSDSSCRPHSPARQAQCHSLSPAAFIAAASPLLVWSPSLMQTLHKEHLAKTGHPSLPGVLTKTKAPRLRGKQGKN